MYEYAKIMRISSRIQLSYFFSDTDNLSMSKIDLSLKTKINFKKNIISSLPSNKFET